MKSVFAWLGCALVWLALAGCASDPEVWLTLVDDTDGLIACPDSVLLATAPCVARGAVLPLRVVGDADRAWTIELSGHSGIMVARRSVGGGAAVTATMSGVGSSGPRPALTSSAWATGGWLPLIGSGQQQAFVDAQLSFAVAGPEPPGGAQIAYGHGFRIWRLAPTVQAIVIDFQAGFADAVARFGLTQRIAALKARILALVGEHFAGFSVAVGSEPPRGIVEFLTVEVGADDPNGLGLLGSDNTLGKDVGNQRLHETIGGFNPAARSVGRAAYGGVFAGELFVYSRKLHPLSGVADQGFDALFAPFAPELGGQPATANDDAGQAVEALAQLVAGTISHEAGHSLGLPAGIDGAHHQGDHPLWRMDEGVHRPFQERAGLSGTEVWGPIDADYLAKILPLQ